MVASNRTKMPAVVSVGLIMGILWEDMSSVAGTIELILNLRRALLNIIQLINSAYEINEVL